MLTVNDMKKVLCLAVLTLLLASCHNFQKDAERQMVKTLKATASDPNARLHDVETVFSSDSLVIIDGTLSGVGYFGKHIDMRVEYIYGIDADGRLRDFVFDIDERGSVVARAEEYRRSLKEDSGLERDSIQCIRDVAMIMDLAPNGQDIK